MYNISCFLQSDTSEQLKALQTRYIELSQQKDNVEAEKIVLDNSYKTQIADLEQKLAETSGELSHFHKELQKAQDDDIPQVS